MSAMPPPPPGPPPSAPPPSGPPPAGPPPSASGGPSAVLLGGIGVLVIAIVAVIVIVAVAFGGGEADSVEEVAEQAVEAAEDLDVDAGIDLLCDVPSDEEREDFLEFLAEAKEQAGTDDPDVTYEISDIEGDREGSFRVVITSDEEAFEGKRLEAIVTVETDGDRSCIADAEPVD